MISTNNYKPFLHAFYFFFCLFAIGCTGEKNTTKDLAQINTTLDKWHEAAGKADYANYFKYMADDGIFIGTDATEHWDKKSFMVWAKPFFDKGEAWNFKSLERHVYFSGSGDIAWFDELLDTQMKICRGSGVLAKQGENWKIEQYVLSMTMPNDLLDTIISLKSPIEDEIIKKLKAAK